MIHNKVIACLCLFGAAGLSACEGKRAAQNKKALPNKPVTNLATSLISPKKLVPVIPSETARTADAPTTTDTAQVLARALGDKMRGYQLESIIRGNLNADKIADFVVILLAIKPEAVGSGVDGAFRRRVALVLNHGYLKLKLAAYNDNVIECTDCGGPGVGDPNQGVIVHYPYLTFKSLYGAWEKDAITMAFKYSPHQYNWLLYKTKTYTYSLSDKNHDGEPDAEEAVRTVRNFGRITFAQAGTPSYLP